MERIIEHYYHLDIKPAVLRQAQPVIYRPDLRTVMPLQASISFNYKNSYQHLLKMVLQNSHT